VTETQRNPRFSAAMSERHLSWFAGLAAAQMTRTFSVTEVAGRAAQTFQFALPNPCFQSLITSGGNSRLPIPVRRQASGHISSKK
jgi:hypothetical protein